MSDVHVELLVGRRVVDANGEVAGRLQRIMADRVGLECVVSEYRLGAGALLERLGLASRGGLVVPWQQMDLSDPLHPRLRCTNAELLASQGRT
jgi:sporulation protein YlmC with PRC-barrel domain